MLLRRLPESRTTKQTTLRYIYELHTFHFQNNLRTCLCLREKMFPIMFPGRAERRRVCFRNRREDLLPHQAWTNSCSILPANRVRYSVSTWLVLFCLLTFLPLFISYFVTLLKMELLSLLKYSGVTRIEGKT